MSPAGPLAGVRVLELCQYIAGPYACGMLADLGAEVIKVESPKGGDPFRAWQSSQRPYSPQFAAYNRNQLSVTINLRSPRGREVLRRLVASADLLVENFRPGTMEGLQVGYDSLREINPKLVYASLSGFGATGPYAARPSYDSVSSAMSGLYSLILDPENPTPVGPAFSDLIAGLFCAQSALAALVRARDTGVGERVDSSMIGSMLAFLAEPTTMFLDAGIVSGPTDRVRRAQVYAAHSGDELPFVVHLSLAEKFWLALTTALGREDLRTDERFATRESRIRNYSLLDSELKTIFRGRPRAEWFEILDAHDIPHGAIATFADVFDDPQVRHMDLIRRVTSPVGEQRLLRPPAVFGDSGERELFAAPLLGEHTTRVLADLGCSQDELSTLQQEGVV